jgi:hypothetical protein
MSLGQDESIEGANTTVDHVPSSEDMEPEEAIVSLHASHSNPKQTIMRFKGKLVINRFVHSLIVVLPIVLWTQLF